MNELKYLKRTFYALVLLVVLVFTMLYRQERIINRIGKLENEPILNLVRIERR